MDAELRFHVERPDGANIPSRRMTPEAPGGCRLNLEEWNK